MWLLVEVICSSAQPRSFNTVQPLFGVRYDDSSVSSRGRLQARLNFELSSSQLILNRSDITDTIISSDGLWYLEKEWGGAGRTPRPCRVTLPSVGHVPLVLSPWSRGTRLSENQSLQRGREQWIIGVTDFGSCSRLWLYLLTVFMFLCLRYPRFACLLINGGRRRRLDEYGAISHLTGVLIVSERTASVASGFVLLFTYYDFSF